MEKFLESFVKLKTYCEAEGFKGWDPYDGLTSKVFNAIPFANRIPLLRMILIQGFKRSSVNFRKIAGVAKDYNAKGIALMLSAYCNLYDSVKHNSELSDDFGSEDQIKQQIVYLADLLISLKSNGPYHGDCWGYYFGWQSKAFYLPPGTPTVVATSFAAEALLRAFEITKNKAYLDSAISSADFILNDLNRIPKPDGFMFSYSPLDDRAVYNATLLGTKTLSLVYSYTKDERIKEIIDLTIQPILFVQNPDGSFPHSDQVGNKWRDNFHTGFKLESLTTCLEIFPNSAVQEARDRCYSHWITNFFDREHGIAKYYETDSPESIIDLHCVAQSIPTIYRVGKMKDEEGLVKSMIEWAVRHMMSPEGYFYFQKKGNKINRCEYMRWPNSWMLYGISFYIKWLAENGKI